MKLLFLTVLAALAALAFTSTADAGDQLLGHKSYRMVNTAGQNAGHVSTNSDGSTATYYPGDGGSPIVYDWDSTSGKYKNSDRGDYFEFFYWPSWTWKHDYDSSSAGSETSGTFSGNPKEMVADPVPL